MIKNEARLLRYLDLWSTWQRNDRAEINRKLGYKISKMVKSNGNKDFDQLADSEESKAAIAVDSIINDGSMITIGQRAALHHIHLGSKWQYSDVGLLPMYESALISLESGINKKGLA